MSAQPSVETWRDRGACRGPHATVFFPPPQFERKFERLEREDRAKDICSTCPVKVDCLDYALEIRESHGIWGGFNEAERKALIADRTAQPNLRAVSR